jgi:hypothetical protein
LLTGAKQASMFHFCAISVRTQPSKATAIARYGALSILLLSLAGCDGGIWVRGIVVTPEGAAIHGAHVTVSKQSNGRSFSDTSSSSGCFHAGGTTAPGKYDYTLHVEAPGWKPAEGFIRTLRNNYVVVKLQPSGEARESELTHVPSDPCPEANR